MTFMAGGVGGVFGSKRGREREVLIVVSGVFAWLSLLLLRGVGV
jgi:hypothetical protein